MGANWPENTSVTPRGKNLPERLFQLPNSNIDNLQYDESMTETAKGRSNSIFDIVNVAMEHV